VTGRQVIVMSKYDASVNWNEFWRFRSLMIYTVLLE